MLPSLIKLLHILSFLFMSAPFYSLIVVNERARFGGGMNMNTDRYMENMIKGQSLRCYVFQISALLTGLLLLWYNGMGFGSLLSNWALLVKWVLLVFLLILLSIVHFGIQPRIEALLGQVAEKDPFPQEIASQIAPLRLKRKKLAAFCLFLVVTTIIVAVQIYKNFTLSANLLLLLLAALFSWRVFKKPVPFGWV